MDRDFTGQLAAHLSFRNIGPTRGGRVVAVAGDPAERNTFWFGACAGGVWKTEDAGTHWRCVSDGHLGSAAIGALAVAPSDSNVLYVGTGECAVRSNVVHGDGVYRSRDHGRSWQHVGLTDTRFISQVRVHPANPDVVYVAALGDIWGPSDQRGIFRSSNGGETWEKVLSGAPLAGAADLAMDPSNPRVLFAAIWQAQRTPWSMSSGGSDSGLFRSLDGGDTWEPLRGRPGFPEATLGRIGVTVSPARRGRVWAQIEAADGKGGVYRSEDHGDTWHRVNQDGRIGMRPFYYSHVYADPADPQVVWVANLELWRSSDGGVTFVEVPTPHLDQHGLWIDPSDPQRLIASSDGGAVVSLNGGASWSSIYNQPTAQFYHCDIDPRFPYRVLGTQQDNTAVGVPSRTVGLAILWRDCDIWMPSESGHIVVDPVNPDVVYAGGHGLSAGGGGGLMRQDATTDEVRAITVEPELVMGDPADPARGRYQWTYPIAFSPHDPGMMYVGGNRIHVSRDEGQTWEAISGDLSHADPDKLGPTGGPITMDNSGAEVYCTVFAIAESPIEAGLLWAGTDDGRVWQRRREGGDWNEVTPPDLPKWATVATIEASPTEAGTAYLAAHAYRLQDHDPWLARTRDHGATWERIDRVGEVDGLQPGDITRVIRCDPVQPGLLWVGTERGVAASLDDGMSWNRLGGGLPVVPVHDLKLVDDALVVATHGRGFWICDDVGILRQATAAPQDGLHLFRPAPAVRFGVPPEDMPLGFSDPQHGALYPGGQDETAVLRHVDPDGEIVQHIVGGGANPAYGVVLHYRVPDGLDDEARGSLRVRDGNGVEVAEFTSTPPGKKWPKVAVSPGLHTFNWKLESAGGRGIVPPTGELPYEAGPQVPPGTYELELEIGGHRATTNVDVRDDPRLAPSVDAATQRYELQREIQALKSQVNDRVVRLKSVRSQVQDWQDRVAEDHPFDQSANEALHEVDRLLGLLVEEKVKALHDLLLQPPSLSAKIDGLATFVSAGRATPPTASAHQLLADLADRVRAALAEVDSAVQSIVASTTAAIAEHDLAAVDVSWSGRRRDRDKPSPQARHPRSTDKEPR